MSQINDALKKAKQAQANAPLRESAPQLRSPEADHPVHSGSSLVLPAMVVVIGLLGAALVWVAMSGRKPATQKAASGAAVNPPLPSPKAGQAVAPSSREVVSPPTPAESAPAAVAESNPGLAALPQTTVAAPPVAVSPPAPVLPKLNGIFFNPNKPTAIVNNKLVSVGSRVSELTVVAITQRSVTLAGNGRTNVLSLSE